MKKIAVIYARVSTLQQEEEATIESQVSALETYAQTHDYELSADAYYLDQAVSGARLQRPALDRLRDCATEGAFSTVLCLSPDRLARQYAHQWVLLDELQRVGVKVIFVNQPAQVEGAQGQLLLGIQGLFSEYERAMITERMRRGKLYRLRHGQLMPPNPPYGYRYIPIRQDGGGQWAIDEAKAIVVRQIYQWYTTNSLTISGIAKRLGEQAILTTNQHRYWSYASVRAILKQQAYTGCSFYNRTQRHYDTIGRPRKSGRGVLTSAENRPRSRDEWIELSTPVILDKQLWQLAQDRLQMSRKFASRNNKQHTYLFRSLLVCHLCSRTLIGRTNKNGSFYYCPNGGKHRSPDVPAHSCTIPGHILDPLVWSEITRLLHNPTLLEDSWHDQSQSAPPQLGEKERLQSRLRSLERQWVRVLDLYQDSLIEKSELEARKAALDQARAASQKRLRQLQKQLQQQHSRQQVVQDFAAFAQKITASLDHPSPKLQQEVIQLLIEHIVIEPDAIVIRHIIPTDSDCRLKLGHISVKIELWHYHFMIHRVIQ